MSTKLIILGAGESGIGAALLAKQKGYDVFVSDAGVIAEKYVQELTKNEIPFEQSGHNETLILNASEVVKSPGIPEKSAIVQKIRLNNISVI
jgi:UDP-N-acetylmuramoylalanine--D-glutamate ligase